MAINPSTQPKQRLTRVIVNIPTELVGRIQIYAGQSQMQVTDVIIEALRYGMSELERRGPQTREGSSNSS